MLNFCMTNFQKFACAALSGDPRSIGGGCHDDGLPTRAAQVSQAGTAHPGGEAAAYRGPGAQGLVFIFIFY